MPEQYHAPTSQLSHDQFQLPRNDAHQLAHLLLHHHPLLKSKKIDE